MSHTKAISPFARIPFVKRRFVHRLGIRLRVCKFGQMCRLLSCMGFEIKWALYDTWLMSRRHWLFISRTCIQENTFKSEIYTFKKYNFLMWRFIEIYGIPCQMVMLHKGIRTVLCSWDVLPITLEFSNDYAQRRFGISFSSMPKRCYEGEILCEASINPKSQPLFPRVKAKNKSIQSEHLNTSAIHISV